MMHSPPVRVGLLTACAFLFAASASFSANNEVSFVAPYHPVQAVGYPLAHAVGDLNQDGLPDIVTANYFESFSLFLGKGDGTFGPRYEVRTGSNGPSAIAVADMDEDGVLDVVTANRSLSLSSSISVFPGNGDGTFATRNDVSVADAFTLAISDFDRDGHLDVATANAQENSVSVCFGDGHGHLGSPIHLPMGIRPGRVTTADFNGDGWPDLATSNLTYGANNVSVILGTGNGTFASPVGHTLGTSTRAIAAVDVNEDHRIDLIALVDDSKMTVWLGGGDGTFTHHDNSDIGYGGSALTAADFDRDGHVDLVTNGASTLSILRGDGTGVFSSAIEIECVSENALSIAASDLDLDGHLDLSVPHASSARISIHLGDGKGGFGAEVRTPIHQNPLSMRAGDLNSDDHLDLVTMSPNSYGWCGLGGTATVLLGKGDGTFCAPSHFETGSAANATDLAIADLDRDGDLDLAAVGLCDTVSVLLGNGDGTFGRSRHFPVQYYATDIAIEDMDADGWLDMLILSVSSGVISVLRGLGGGEFGHRTEFSVHPFARDFAVADLNGDSRPDVITANCDGTISVLLGNGDGTLRPRTDVGSGSVCVVAVADFNRDSKVDLATASWNGEAPAALLGGGDGTFTPAPPGLLGPAGFGAVVADFDLDGHLDLATVNTYTFSVLLGRGDGTFRSRTDFGASEGAYSVVAGDFNEDGRPDIATAQVNFLYKGTVSVHLNQLPTVTMGFELDPKRLAVGSVQARPWVTGFLEPPAPFVAEDIVPTSVRLNGGVAIDPSGPLAMGDRDGDGLRELSAKFSRAQLGEQLAIGSSIVVLARGAIGERRFMGRGAVRVEPAGRFDRSASDVSSIAPTAEINEEPVSVGLAPILPNPSSGAIRIRFALARGESTRLEVFDVQGRKVAMLVDRWSARGSHEVRWDGRDASGQMTSPGLYYAHLRAGDWESVKRFVVLR